jgi:hypothetical protein
MLYLFAPEYGPPPQAQAAPPPPAGARGRGPRGSLIGTWFFAISH